MAATSEEALGSELGRAEQTASGRQRGLWSDAWHRLTRNRLAVVSCVILIAIASFSIAWNAFEGVRSYEPGDQDYAAVQEGPSSAHWFGTDNLGRDNFARVMEGTLISLKVGLGAQVVILVVGVLVGASAVLTGKLGDNLLMRLTDLAYAFPDLLFIILMRAVLSGRDWPILGSGDPQVPGFSGDLLQVILAISIVGWTTIARLVRGQMLSIKEMDYVLAARALGATQSRIVYRHMLPNTLGPVIVAITFGIPIAIFAEAALGFIGFGLPPPTASLGGLISDGYVYIRSNEWIAVFPAIFISIFMLCFTFLGDGLRDALDPRSR
ncbi:MAG: ABC transporter permease subunit [Dehalococcoidia bacterium]|nr:ABC transporter permease subunit [Dehalococcoidia bacterium]